MVNGIIFILSLGLVWNTFETTGMKLFGFTMIMIMLTTLSLSAQDTLTIRSGKRNYRFVLHSSDTPRTIKFSLPCKYNPAAAGLFVCYKPFKKAPALTRRLMLYTTQDSGLLNFTKISEEQYSIPFKTLQQLNPRTYLLYTVAVPADPKKAALVRVAKTLVCKIEVQ